MNVKNILIKWLIDLLKLRKGKPPGNKKSFLVISTTGLGDTLWATPAIKALRTTYPDAYIGALTSPVGKEVLKNNPHLSEIFTVKDPLFVSLIRLFFPLRKRAITTALIFHTSQRPILPFAFLLGATEIIGTQGINKDLDFILTKALEPKKVHEIERRLKIVAEVGARTADPFLELFTTEEDEKKVREFYQKNEIPSYLPIVGMHPGAKDKFKQWDPKCFIELGNRLKDHLGCQILLTGNASEKELIEEISSQIPGSIAVTEPLALSTLSALMKKMSLFISNDTGPMHIAFASCAPTVALFCPTDPKLCGPHFAPRVVVIKKEKTCTPCSRKKCNSPFCLLQISVSEVYEAALKLFYNQNESLLALNTKGELP